MYVSVIFSGGAGLDENQQARDGRYALPLLARHCTDGAHWVGFTLSAVGFEKGVCPTGPDVQQDIAAGAVPAGVPADLPDCVLITGTISGRMLVHGAPAPAGTRVTSAGPPGGPNLAQAVVTVATAGTL